MIAKMNISSSSIIKIKIAMPIDDVSQEDEQIFILRIESF
jgi:hypothetical protein